MLAATQSQSRGSARLTGLAGCVKTTKTARVSGRKIRSVVFSLDGHKLRTVKAKNSRLATAKVTLAQLKTGTHKLTARVTFTDGTKAKTLTLRFSRCSTAAISPRFTG